MKCLLLWFYYYVIEHNLWYYVMILYRLYRYEIQKQWGKLLFYNDGNIDGLSLLESSGELKKITELSTENYRWNYRQTKSLGEF